MGTLLLVVLLCKFVTFDKPDYATELYQQGMTHALRGEYNRADQFFTEALRLEPRESELWLCRSLARGMTGNLDGAASDWTESKRWERETIQKAIEEAYEAREWSKVIEHTEWLYHKKKLAPTGQFYHAVALIGLDRARESLPFMKRALEHEEELEGVGGQAHYIQAQLLLNELRFTSVRKNEICQEAITHFDLAWKLGCQTILALRQRAYANWELDKKLDAIRDMRQATLVESKSASLRLELIQYLARAERWADVEEELNWMKRLSMTATEQAQYAAFHKQAQAATQVRTADKLSDDWLKSPVTQITDKWTKEKK